MAPTKKIQIPLYLEREAYADLKKLSKKSRVPQQSYLREAVDILLAKYRGMT
jgi:hypothetical protein